MDEVDHHGDVHLALLGLGLDAVDLVTVAVDQGHPSALVTRVPPLGLVEHLADHLGGVLDDARRHPLARGPWRRRCVFATLGGQHVGGAAGHGREVIDSAYLGHALAVALFSLGQSGL